MHRSLGPRPRDCISAPMLLARGGTLRTITVRSETGGRRERLLDHVISRDGGRDPYSSPDSPLSSGFYLLVSERVAHMVSEAFSARMSREEG